MQNSKPAIRKKICALLMWRQDKMICEKWQRCLLLRNILSFLDCLQNCIGFLFPLLGENMDIFIKKCQWTSFRQSSDTTSKPKIYFVWIFTSYLWNIYSKRQTLELEYIYFVLQLFQRASDTIYNLANFSWSVLC